MKFDPSPRPAAVVFDFDGVLADSAQVYLELYRDVAIHFGKVPPIATVAEWREWYQPRWERNFEAIGLGGPRLPEAIGWAFSRLRYDRVRIFTGVAAALEDLARDCALAIASSTRAPLIEELLEREGLRARFALVLGGTDRGSDKSEMVGEALRTLGAGPDRTVVVGDTTADVEAARACGLPVVGVTYGWMTAQRLAPARPEALVAAPGDLPAAVRSVLKASTRVPASGTPGRGRP